MVIGHWFLVIDWSFGFGHWDFIQGAFLNSTFAVILAQPTPATKPVDPGPFGFLASPMLPIVLGIVVLYFFMSKSGRGGDKQRQNRLKEMKKGDEVQTIGGIIGKIVEAREDRVLVKVDETANTKIWFSRNAIHQVLEEDKSETK
jgi:preprotein translocase subunit YajC